MRDRRPGRTFKGIRQDLCFIVSILLLVSVALAVLTGLSGDEAEFFGLGDGLHGFVGWSMVVLTVLHTLLHWGHMVGYVKRRLRRSVGVGSVLHTSSDYCREQQRLSRRRDIDDTGTH